eukprot:g3624.t1
MKWFPIFLFFLHQTNALRLRSVEVPSTQQTPPSTTKPKIKISSNSSDFPEDVAKFGGAIPEKIVETVSSVKDIPDAVDHTIESVGKSTMNTVDFVKGSPKEISSFVSNILSPKVAPVGAAKQDNSEKIKRSCVEEITLLSNRVNEYSELEVSPQDSPRPRALSPSVALWKWCMDTFAEKYKDVERSLTTRLCLDLKEISSRLASATSSGKSNSTGQKLASEFCEKAEFKYIEAFKLLVNGEQLEGSNLFERYQLSNEPVETKSFYGARSHNSIEQDSWDTTASCCEPHIGRGCKDDGEFKGISQCVCSKDIYCCQNRWDMACVRSIEELCGYKCK